MSKLQLTARQATIWFFLHQASSAILVLPSTLTAIAKQDAWLSVICAGCLQLLWLPLYVSIAGLMKGGSVGDLLNRLFGVWAGKALLALLVIGFPFLLFILTLRNLGDYLTTSIIAETPIEAVYALTLIVVIYGGKLGVRAIGRAAEAFFPLVLLLIIICAVSLLFESRIQNILPILENGIKPVIRGSVTLIAFPYMETVLFLFFLPLIGDKAQFKSAIWKSTFTSIFIYTMFTLLVILLLSPEVTRNLTFPSYFAVRTISMAHFYERFEILIAVLYFITIFFRLSLLMYVSSQGFAELFGLSSASSLLLPLALIAFYLANIVVPRFTVHLDLIKAWPSYAMLYGIALPLLWWTAARVRRWVH